MTYFIFAKVFSHYLQIFISSEYLKGQSNAEPNLQIPSLDPWDDTNNKDQGNGKNIKLLTPLKGEYKLSKFVTLKGKHIFSRMTI